MINEAIIKLTQKEDLSRDEMYSSIEEIMKGETSPAQIASFLTASSIKGISLDELVGAALAMRHFSKKVNTKNKIVVDTCGTGGDSKGTFSISTIASIVVAGAGVCVAKHGNRSASGKFGSADLLEALGVKIDVDEKKVEECIEKNDIGFMFAPVFHPAMKYAHPVRKELGLRTIFNFLGPLTNPASTKYQLLGVSEENMLKDFALALKELGSIHAMVVRGKDGLDEITTTTETRIFELKNSKIKEFDISPEDFGIKKVKLKEILCKDKKTDVAMTREILSGKSGPKRDIVCLNAGAALYTAGKVPSIKEGLELARITIDSGRAKEKLRSLIEFTNEAPRA